MAKQLTFGFTQEAAATRKIDVPTLALSTDYAVTKNDQMDVYVSNLTSPTDQPETLRYGSKSIQNIYNNSGIDPSFYATSKRGLSIVSELFEVASITDTDDPSFRIDYPIQTHVVIKVPVSQYVNANDVLTILLRNVSMLFQQSNSTSTRISELMHGAMVPSELR